MKQDSRRYYPRARIALQALECVLTNFDKRFAAADKNVGSPFWGKQAGPVRSQGRSLSRCDAPGTHRSTGAREVHGTRDDDAGWQPREARLPARICNDLTLFAKRV